VARIDGPPIVKARLEIDGSEAPVVVDTGKTFDLERDDDGAVVRIDASKAQVVPLAKHSGAWSEAGKHPMARGFDHKAPGPHIDVELRGALIVEGDTVERRR
jgi:hypothetical protein